MPFNIWWDTCCAHPGMHLAPNSPAQLLLFLRSWGDTGKQLTCTLQSLQFPPFDFGRESAVPGTRPSPWSRPQIHRNVGSAGLAGDTAPVAAWISSRGLMTFGVLWARSFVSTSRVPSFNGQRAHRGWAVPKAAVMPGCRVSTSKGDGAIRTPKGDVYGTPI